MPVLNSMSPTHPEHVDEELDILERALRKTVVVQEGVLNFRRQKSQSRAHTRLKSARIC